MSSARRLAGVLLPLAWTLLGGLAAAKEPAPVVAGAEGQAAFDDLAAHYREEMKTPDFYRALAKLKSDSDSERQSAGKYLLALLAQSSADETNGRAHWRRTPFWGGGAESAAREFRHKLAEALAEAATGDEALEAARWLLDTERQPDNQLSGAKALARIDGPEAAVVIEQQLAGPHPNEAVTLALLDEVGSRKLVRLGPQVRRLCGSFRRDIREKARALAADLGLADIPEYDPRQAFTPRLEAQLKQIAALVYPPIPAAAKWAHFKVTVPPYREGGEPQLREFGGWIVGEDADAWQVVNFFGDAETLARPQTQVEPRDWQAEVDALIAIREQPQDLPLELPLSRRGGLTGQFESRAISLPEALVAAWAFRAGDKLAAALLLFPRLDDLADDRWLGWIVRDMIGHACHQQMLAAFSHSRDYPQALALARHLSQPLFEGYQYQDRAVELAAQLARREEDFKTFVLPPPDEWTALQKKLSRAEQIEFLASHLRLLNCFQWGQPGGVNLEDPQFATPHYLGVPGDKRDEPEQVINPYVELLGLKLAVADLPALLPRVLDEDFLPTFSYWRDFHPSRTMYRVNELAASVINDTAKRELVSLGALGELDAAERQAYLGTLLKWCQDNRDKTREDLLLDTVTTTNDWRQFARAAAELVHDKSDKVLPILVERSDQFGSTASEDDIVELCYRLDSPAAAAPARNWLTSAEKGTRFWAALILLGHGDQDRLEGLDVLAELLANDSGSDWYPRAIEPLCATGKPRALELACGILARPDARPPGEILLRLLLTGRREVLDYLLTQLKSDKRSGTTYGVRDGQDVQRETTVADSLAADIAGWRTDGYEYDTLAPDDDRRAACRQLAEWLEKQFALIQDGKSPDALRKPAVYQSGNWQLDAP